MLAEVHPGQANQQEGGGGEGGYGEAGGHLAQDGGAAHGQARYAEALGGLRQHGQHAVIEGVGIKQQGGGHTDDAGDGREEPAQGGGDDRHQGVGHGGDHAGAFHDAGEAAGGKEHRAHHQAALGVGVHPGLGVGHLGIVDEGGQHIEHHEHHRGGKAGLQQAGNGGHDEENIHPEQVGTEQGLLLVGQLRLHVLAALQGHSAQTGLLGAAQEYGDDNDAHQTGDDGGQHRHEEGHRVAQLPLWGKGVGGADGGAAPGQDVHGSRRQGHDGGQGGALHAQRVIQGQQGGDAD